MEVANRHIWMLLLCLLENSYKPNRKTKLQTRVLPFALEVLNCVVLLISSRLSAITVGQLLKCLECA